MLSRVDIFYYETDKGVALVTGIAGDVASKMEDTSSDRHRSIGPFQLIDVLARERL